MSGPFDVAIVGAGASGTLTALQLLRRAPAGFRLAWIERGSRFGPGLAYGTRCPRHLLNVPASGMSAFDGEPLHFARWLGEGQEDVFAPRARFGAYLEETLAQEARRSSARLERLQDTVVGHAMAHGRVRLHLASGAPVDAKEAVLALGNPPPSDVPGVPGERSSPERYLAQPWTEGALQALPKDAPVLLLGTGLTAVDVLLALREGGHEGTVLALSRRGLLPRSHAPHPQVRIPPLPPLRSVSALARVFRERLAEAARQGGDFRSVIDAVRPDVAPCWVALSPDARRRWMRHARALWEVHRHRMAPEIACALDAELASGGFVPAAGRIQEVRAGPEGQEVRYRPRGGAAPRSLRVAAIINCTGPGKLADLPGTLVGSLFAAGQARWDPLGLGISTDPEGRLLDAQGRPQPGLWTLGPPRRGDLWESTAVPEIRTQARALADALLR